MATIFTPYYVLKLPTEDIDFMPDPVPGSVDAQAMGCLCPEEKPPRGFLHIGENCPVHPLVPPTVN